MFGTYKEPDLLVHCSINEHFAGVWQACRSFIGIDVLSCNTPVALVRQHSQTLALCLKLTLISALAAYLMSGSMHSKIDSTLAIPSSKNCCLKSEVSNNSFFSCPDMFE